VTFALHGNASPSHRPRNAAKCWFARRKTRVRTTHLAEAAKKKTSIRTALLAEAAKLAMANERNTFVTKGHVADFGTKQ
jgi:hypothetical protein